MTGPARRPGKTRLQHEHARNLRVLQQADAAQPGNIHQHTRNRDSSHPHRVRTQSRPGPAIRDTWQAERAGYKRS
jgi:hypothetical protein